VAKLPSGTVTFLFTDIEGSTRLLHEFGDRYAEVLAEHRRALRDAFARHGGFEVDTQGDAFFVAFAEASEAVAAAAEGCDALESGPIHVRIGVHTGEPLLTEEGYVGIDVHRAARIMSAGHGGQVLVSERTRSLLDDGAELVDLGLHRLKDMGQPEKLFQLGRGEFPPLKTLDATNLPIAASPLLGRERELDELLSLLANSSRLVTITGPGGTGKTRLALQVAAELVGSYADGVFWVPLAGLSDPRLVLATIAQTIGADDELGEHLRGKALFLLLDNLEHLLLAAPDVAGLLAVSKGVRLLVTSRAPLRVSGEREYLLDPLLPSDAVTLFCERVRAAGRELQPSETVEAICRRLDGLPLAIELAAARTRLLAPDTLLQRLEHALPLLTGGARDAPERQQTLRATIEWSFDLLDDEAKRLFARLAVFAGGFSLEAAEAVCEAELDALGVLADSSLVKPIGDERFLILETIREYALDRLQQVNEAKALKQKHAEYYAALAERMRADIRNATPAARQVLQDELDNVRAALEWVVESHAVKTGATIIEATWPFWISSALLREGLEWSRRMLDMSGSLPPAERVGVLHAAGELTRFSGDLTEAWRLKGEELEILRALEGEERRLAVVLADLSWIAIEQRDLLRARELSEEALTVREQLGEEKGVAHAQMPRAMIMFFEGRFEEARRIFRESADVWQNAGAFIDRAGAILMCGECSRRIGELGPASQDLRDALSLFIQIEERFGFPECLQEVGALELLLDHPELAASFFGAAEKHRLELGIPLWDPEDWEKNVAAVKLRLGPVSFLEHWQKGERMTLREAMEVALSAVD
jgi:predicted ATPase/class 3 adenylate cyclase